MYDSFGLLRHVEAIGGFPCKYSLFVSGARGTIWLAMVQYLSSYSHILRRE